MHFIINIHSDACDRDQCSTVVEPCDLMDIRLAQSYPTGGNIKICTHFTLKKLITFSQGSTKSTFVE
jgi:hypothetical protein